DPQLGRRLTGKEPPTPCLRNVPHPVHARSRTVRRRPFHHPSPSDDTPRRASTRPDGSGALWTGGGVGGGGGGGGGGGAPPGRSEMARLAPMPPFLVLPGRSGGVYSPMVALYMCPPSERSLDVGLSKVLSTSTAEADTVPLKCPVKRSVPE